MKKLALLVALFSAAPALAQQTLIYKSETGMLLTAAAPSAATDGVKVEGAQGYCVTITAPAGQTISGGSMLCYAYVCVAANNDGKCTTRRWNRCPATLDFTPGTSQRDPPSGDYETLAGVARIAYRSSSITLSGAGTTIDVTYTVRERK